MHQRARRCKHRKPTPHRTCVCLLYGVKKILQQKGARAPSFTDIFYFWIKPALPVGGWCGTCACRCSAALLSRAREIKRGSSSVYPERSGLFRSGCSLETEIRRKEDAKLLILIDFLIEHTIDLANTLSKIQPKVKHIVIRYPTLH